MAIQIVRNQIIDSIIDYGKIDSGIVETNLASSAANNKLARADAIKSYVDSEVGKISSNSWKEAVIAATTAQLTANYANGTNGDGATITATGNGAFPNQDGQAITIGQRVLVKDGVSGLGANSQAGNGVYTLTTVGDGSNPYVLTRAADANSAAEIRTMVVPVAKGTVSGGKYYNLAVYAPANIDGTTNIPFDVFRSFASGDGISMTAANGALDTLAIDLATNPGLQFTSNKLDLKLDGGTLTKGGSGLSVASVPNALSAGNGITAAGAFDGAAARSFAVQAADASISVAGGGVSVALAAATAIENDSGLKLKAATAGDGLAISASQVLSVNVDDSSIETDSDTLRVKAAGITNAMLAGSIADSKLLAISSANKVEASALELATNTAMEDDSGLCLKAGIAGDGLAMAESGGNQVLSVGVDDVGIEINSDALRLKDSGVATAKIADNAINFAKLGVLPKFEKFTGNGSTSAYALASRIDSGNLADFKRIARVYRNGLRVEYFDSMPGSADEDMYTVTDNGSATVITFGANVPSGDVIIVDYWA